MHQIIRVIVYAKDKGAALKRAKSILNILLQNNTFDYYVTFDDNTSTIAGRGRWGDISPVVPIHSVEGIKLVKDGWNATIEDFMNYLFKLRKTMKYKSDIKLMNDRNFRFYAYEVGKYAGSAVWLYDDNSEGIRTIDHLKNAVNKWKFLNDSNSQKREKLKVWIVPADIHV